MRKKYAKKKGGNMRFQKEENTQIRFEKDGIYIMNSKYQSKEKITDIENEGIQFY